MEVKLYTATTEDQKEAAYRLRYELYVEDQELFQNEADHEAASDADDGKERHSLAQAGARTGHASTLAPRAGQV